MTYEPEDRDSIAIDEDGGSRTGLIVGVVIIVVLLALLGSFLVSGLQLGAGAGNGGGPQPTVEQPSNGT